MGGGTSGSGALRPTVVGSASGSAGGAWRRLRGGVAVTLAVLAAACGGAAPADTPPAADTAAAPNNSTAPGGGGDSLTGPAPAVEGATRVLVAGTSLTAGLGLDPDDAYPALLQRKADSAGYAIEVVNAGLSGETSAGLVRRIDWLLREPAAVVVIETGANDGLRGLDPDSTRANLRAIAGKVRSALPGAELLLVQMEAPPNLGADYTRRFRAMYGEVARETGATLVPFLLEGVAGVETLNQADGIHPNEEGAALVAGTVWQALGPALARVDRSGGGR